MRLCTIIGPPQSVHGSPWASSEVHWFHVSLAHDWRTATLAVLSKTTSYTGGLVARAVATKMPKPGDPSVLGFEQKLVLIRAREPWPRCYGSSRRLRRGRRQRDARGGRRRVR